MRCGQCQFENMPGLERCFQCGAVLTDAKQVDVSPPRMPAWQRPLRGLGRWVRNRRSGGGKHAVTPPKKSRHVIGWQFFKILAAAALSIIPGLGHLAVGKFGKVWWRVLIWMLFAALAVFMYGSSFGYLALGLAVVMHAQIAVHWPDEEGLRGFGRLGAMLTMALLAVVLYTAVFHAYADRNLRWVHAPFAVSSKMVHRGDMLLARTTFSPAEIRRGALVLANLQVVWIGRETSRLPILPNMVVQVVGLAGDTVEVKADRFYVDGRQLSAEEYNFPTMLKGRETSILVPEDSVFVSAEYRVTGAVQVDTAYIMHVCTVREANVTGMVFMRWLPLGRRGFITE
jgi:hypothetical protein